MKKKDYRIEVLRMAIDGNLPIDIDTKCKDSHLLTACVELVESGHIEGGGVRNRMGKPWVFHFLNVTPKGRDCLEELEAKKPIAKIKVKGFELLWTFVTSFVTAIVTTIVTLHLSKPVTVPDKAKDTATMPHVPSTVPAPSIAPTNNPNALQGKP